LRFPGGEAFGPGLVIVPGWTKSANVSEMGFESSFPEWIRGRVDGFSAEGTFMVFNFFRRDDLMATRAFFIIKYAHGRLLFMFR
jgi:hypothetical protein